MYYVIHWYKDRFLIYSSNTKELAGVASRSLTGAIRAFHNHSWCITRQPLRFKFTDTELLEYTDAGTQLLRSHPILHKLPSLDFSYLQQHYPELLI